LRIDKHARIVGAIAPICYVMETHPLCRVDAIITYPEEKRSKIKN
jgi:hypothetical protein